MRYGAIVKLARVDFDKSIMLENVYATASMTVNGRSGETMVREGDTIRIAHEKLPAPGFVLVPWHRVTRCVPMVEERAKPGPKPKPTELAES